MECCTKMIKVKYYPHKYNKIDCYFCTVCGKLVTTYGLIVWRGKHDQKRFAAVDTYKKRDRIS